MNSSRKFGILGAGALVLVGGLAVALREGHADQRAALLRHDQAHAMATAPTAPQALAQGEQNDSRWGVGESRSYAMDFGARVDANEHDPSSWFSVVGSATLELTRVEALDAGYVYLRGELSGFSAVLENEQHTGLQIESHIEKGLDKPFIVKLSESGRILALGSQSEVGSIGYNILRSVISALQFVEPEGKDPSWETWEAEESDQNGVCRARYRKRGGGAFEKTKLGYSYAASAGLGGPTTPRLPTIQSVTKLVWQNGRLASSRLVESIAQPFGDDNLIKTSMHVTLELTGSAQGRGARLDTTGITFRQLFQTKSRPATADEEQARRRELVAGASLRQLAGDLSRLAPSVENRDARFKLSERLTALLELDPAQTRDTIAALRAATSADDRDMLLDALNQADTPEARAALGELARDRNAEPALRDSVVTELGLNERGSKEALEALNSVASDPTDSAIHSAATLALGSAAHAGSGKDDLQDVTARAVETLKSGFASAKTPSEQRLYLDALGNAGSADGLDVVRQGLASPEVSLRAAAIDALRRVPGEEAEQLLAKTLRTDPEPRVRAAAVAALGQRALSTPLLAALGEAVRSDQDTEVRSQVVILLTPLVSALPAARELLTWCAQNDTNPSVKNLAAKALGDSKGLR